MAKLVKSSYLSGVNTNIVADVVITDEHSADSLQFKKLIEKTSQRFNIRDVTADAAYSSKQNHAIVNNLGGTAYIPFKKNATGRAG